MSEITLEGKVKSGRGNGKKYVTMPWVKKQINDKLGFNPYPGTLNLELNPPSISLRKILEQKPISIINPKEGCYVGLLYITSIKKIKSAIVIPKVPSYPDNLLEIIAPVNLRERLQLKNGDSIFISINL